MKETKPIIGITIGDVAGIGPEIVLKALSKKYIYDICKPVVIGDYNALVEIAKLISVDTEFPFTIINCTNLSNIVYGKLDPIYGQAAFTYIKEAVNLALSNKINAIVTAPINKQSLKLAKIEFTDHTEILENLTNSKSLTMFEIDNLRVFFLSKHVSLKKACEMVKKENILNYIVNCNNALKRLGFKNPILAIAALNPHCGDNGLFGDEEINEIEPAIKEANGLGINIVGPVAADSVFYQGLQGKYDAVLSLYHDQGHIGTKTVDFNKTVSITLGLPFIRTSVDHGTAFDIAGKGIANSLSLEEAIKKAVYYSKVYE